MGEGGKHTGIACTLHKKAHLGWGWAPLKLRAIFPLGSTEVNSLMFVVFVCATPVAKGGKVTAGAPPVQCARGAGAVQLFGRPAVPETHTL